MNKLQLYITKSYNGFKVLFNVNPAEEEKRHVRDLTTIVNRVKYDPSEKNIFFFVSTVSTGTFVTIVRTIPPRMGDHLAAWIFIPNEVIIDGPTLENIVNATTRRISAERVTTEDTASLRELFSTEYMTDGDAPAMTASKTNAEPAWRAYNGETGLQLKDLFGPALFQLSYAEYSGIILVDADLGLTADATNLTDTPIAGPAVILPVEPTPEHFVAHVFGRPLDKPLRASRDTTIQIVWRHAGFEDVEVEAVINSGEYMPEAPDTSKSRKGISRASFQIAAQSGRVPLEDCEIKVNDVRIGDEPVMFTSEELTSAIVVINCEGYAPYSAKMDLAASTRALIRLTERSKVYCFEIPVKRADLGAPVRFKLYTKKYVSESPIEGYSARDTIIEGESRTNHLTFNGSGGTWQTKAIYCGIGLVVGLLIGWLTTCGSETTAESSVDSPTVEVSETIVETSGTSTTASTTSSTNNKTATVTNAAVTPEAIAYLDNNETWTKEGLAQHAGLAGLFDDMNNFRLENLSGAWADKLKNSKRFALVAQHSKWGMNPKKKAKSKIDGTQFLKANETKINVQQYLNKVDP